MARTNTDAHKSVYLTDGSVAALPYARGNAASTSPVTLKSSASDAS